MEKLKPKKITVAGEEGIMYEGLRYEDLKRLPFFVRMMVTIDIEKKDFDGYTLSLVKTKTLTNGWMGIFRPDGEKQPEVVFGTLVPRYVTDPMPEALRKAKISEIKDGSKEASKD